jgi:hypothetical protein
LTRIAPLLSPLRIKTILLRMGALACCAVVFLVSGMASYLDTASQYTARVQFPALVDRPRSFIYVTAASYSHEMRIFYVACALGWLLGLVMLRGRPRVLVTAAAASFAGWLLYSTIYLMLLDAVWVPPIPLYIEQCLWVLYAMGAVAGYWSVLQFAARQAQRVAAGKRSLSADVGPQFEPDRLVGFSGMTSGPARAVMMVIAAAALAVVPAKVIHFTLDDAAIRPAAATYGDCVRLPDEPGLMNFLRITSAPRLDKGYGDRSLL